ncbi:MAG TPA: methyltransferase domain-containing protein [Bryobacteraceae bacterium]|nr:methyltransferase domain-containing protein [Bryobacteraceae bacterium]
MSEARNPHFIEENRRQVERLRTLGWYHSIELPDGQVIEGHQSIEQLRRRLALFPIPADLTGKRVLDIGAWDGWFSFEMERRGADVLALDYARSTRLLEAKRILGSKIDYRIGDICRLTYRDLGTFDIVLFLGVLYHVKHPVMALENVCGMCREMACIESFVTGTDPDAVPLMEYYETTELRGQLDNWVGPNAACLMAMTRSAGFARVRWEGALGERGHVTAFRHWEPEFVSGAAPEVVCIENSNTHGHDFSALADDYLTFYFRWAGAGLDCDSLRPVIGGFGSRPIHVAATGEGSWQATCKVPPGLLPGWQAVTLAVDGSARCSALWIGLDVADRLVWPAEIDGSLEVTRVADGKSFEDDTAAVGEGSALSVWVAGLPDSATAGDVSLRLNGTTLPAIWMAAADGGPRQINALLPAGLDEGPAAVSVVYAGKETQPRNVCITHLRHT